MQRDHVQPIIRYRGVRWSFSGRHGCKYPALHCLANIVPACRACNKDKSNLDLETYRGCFEPGHVFYFEKRAVPIRRKAIGKSNQ
jgi:hypothetical protein